MHVRCRRTAVRTAVSTAVRTAAIPAAAAPAVLAATAAPAAARPGTGDMQCYTRTQGSTATATCHNPDPDQVRMRLHIRCARWWDPSVDTAEAVAGPAQTVVLTGRCWKEIRAVWLTLSF